MNEIPDDQMRGFIQLTEELLCAYARVTRPEVSMIVEDAGTNNSPE